MFSLFSIVGYRTHVFVIHSQVAEELPKNLEESVSKFATKSPKVPCFSVVDSHGKTNVSLTYGKLFLEFLSFITFSSSHIEVSRDVGSGTCDLDCDLPDVRKKWEFCFRVVSIIKPTIL